MTIGTAHDGPVLLSLFSGCGGLDLGFEQAGYSIGLAYDLRRPAIMTHNKNRATQCGHVADVRKLSLKNFDEHFGREFRPEGVIGGPPCQSFSRGNVQKSDDDPRRKMVRAFFNLALKIHRHRGGLKFIVMENVPEVRTADHGRLLELEIARLKRAGFFVFLRILNAKDYGVAQSRRRLFLVALHEEHFSSDWSFPFPSGQKLTVRETIGGLEEPVRFANSGDVDCFPEHPNHWCMTPKSRKFENGGLTPGRSSGRSFKTLAWDKPSYTVSYGHREVHVHPDCKRRLSVFESMLLQGFPKSYILHGTMSDQFSQVSEAVPPPLAFAIAQSIADAKKQSLKTAA
jgi:DNA (cytosine-5)-methyltransferase 1